MTAADQRELMALRYNYKLNTISFQYEELGGVRGADVPCAARTSAGPRSRKLTGDREVNDHKAYRKR